MGLKSKIVKKRVSRDSKTKFRIIDHDMLLNLCGYKSLDILIAKLDHGIEEKIKAGDLLCEELWSQNVAAGDPPFLESVLNELYAKGRFKKIETDPEGNSFIKEE